jgi:hypothetical protein
MLIEVVPPHSAATPPLLTPEQQTKAQRSATAKQLCQHHKSRFKRAHARAVLHLLSLLGLRCPLLAERCAVRPSVARRSRTES